MRLYRVLGGGAGDREVEEVVDGGVGRRDRVLRVPHLFAAEVLVRLATDTRVYLSRRGGAINAP